MSGSGALPWRHLLLALAVVAVWGTNFVVIKFALATLPPLLLATLRYGLALLPALVLPRPAVRWRTLAAYGLLIGGGQFGLLFVAMDGHISPGLASLVVQTQVFFTVGLAALRHGERMSVHQLFAVALAAAGLVLIALAADDRSATPLGLALVLGAAASWAGGNIVAKSAGRIDMLAFVVWSSLFSIPPLLLLSWWFEGPAAMLQGLARADAATWVAVVWQALGNTLFGFAAWGWLLARHPAATIVPLALLVPVFGIGASALWLGEALPPWKLAAAALVIGGLGLNLLWPQLRRALRRF